MSFRITQAAYTLGGLCLLLLLSACAGTPLSDRLLATELKPPQLELTQTPFFPQEDYQCGPAALASVLHLAGITVSAEALRPAVYLPGRQGSLQAELLAATRRYGRIPYIIHPSLENLIQELQAGHPVLVLQNLGLSWVPQWHYAVVIGYNTAQQVFILRSGTIARHETTFRTFEHTWARSRYWGMVVLRPGELPVMADADSYLKGVIGLERTGFIQAARTAYETALRQWPGNRIAAIGLGNTAYQLKDLGGAETALRQAMEHHPTDAAIHNNLAQVLLEQGKIHEALPIAQRALELATGDTTPFEETLREIQRKIAATSPTDSDRK